MFVAEIGGSAWLHASEPFPVIAVFVRIAVETVIVSKVMDVVCALFVSRVETVYVACSKGVEVVIVSKW